MPKRKLFILGNSLGENYDRALGLCETEFTRNFMETIDLQEYTINWDKIESALSYKVANEAKSEIDEWYNLEFYRRIRGELERQIIPNKTEDEITDSKFKRNLIELKN